MLVNFRVLHWANVINTRPLPPLKNMPKSCYQLKEMLMAKRRKVLNVHSWLNLAMEDVFLGHLSLFVYICNSTEQVMKLATSSRIHGRMG